MKAMLYISVMLTLLVTACTRQQHPQPPAQASKQVGTEVDAVAIVLADIQRRGGDPHREECSATKTGEGWDVTAWHIFYPTNKGSSRFVPGGFTDYTVSSDGKILKTMPGH